MTDGSMNVDSPVTTLTTMTTTTTTTSAVLSEKEKKRLGGIGWQSGSLVGINNPESSLGYRYSNPIKRYRSAGKNDGADSAGERELPSNVQIRFYNRQGEELTTTASASSGSDGGVNTGTTLDIPTNSSVEDLTALLHTLLDELNPSSARVPYSFYVKVKRSSAVPEATDASDDVEITLSIRDLLLNYKDLSTEATLHITYQPLAVYRVRPVSRCTDTLTGHSDAVLHVSYSPAGTLLASGGGDGVVRFWDIHTGTPRFSTARHHRNHVLCTAWCPSNRKFASGDKSGMLILWDPVTGKPSPNKHIQAHRQHITSIVWEPLHLSTGASKLATASKDCTIKIWNGCTGAPIRTLSGHVDSVECIKWSGEDTNLLYSASRDRSIKVWNVDRGILVRTLTGHAHRVNTLALSTDFVLRTGPFCNVFQNNITFNAKDMKHHVQDCLNDPVKAIAIAKQKYDQFKQQHQSGTDASASERLVSGSDDFTMYLWNPVLSKHPIKRLTGHQQAVNHIVFSPDGRYFASASFDKKIKLWNGFSGEFITTCTGHVGSVYQITWSPDSRYLVSASKDSTAKLWIMPSGKTAQETLPGHADEVYALDWNPNGTSAVATGSKDRTIKIWKH